MFWNLVIRNAPSLGRNISRSLENFQKVIEPLFFREGPLCLGRWWGSQGKKQRNFSTYAVLLGIRWETLDGSSFNIIQGFQAKALKIENSFILISGKQFQSYFWLLLFAQSVGHRRHEPTKSAVPMPASACFTKFLGDSAFQVCRRQRRPPAKWVLWSTVTITSPGAS